MTKLDFQISMTKNKDEEKAISEIERREDTEINDKKLLEAEYEVQSDDDQKAFEDEHEPDVKISEIFIISRLGYFYSTFAIVDSFASMFSSYYYSWLSVYGEHFG